MSPRPNPFLRTVILAVLSCALGGCVTEVRQGDTSTFSFALWFPALVFLGSVAALVGGWFLRRKSARWGWALMLAAVLAGLLFAPGLFLDRATVSPEGFTLRTGFWFAPTRHEARFADLARIRLYAKERQTRRGRRTDVSLLCSRKTGGIAVVPVGDLMKRGPVEKILDLAEERGIEVVAD